MVEGGRRLGLWQHGKFVLSSEGVADVLMDFCIYDCYPGGKNAIARYKAAVDLAPTSEEASVLEALAQLPPLSLFRIEQTTPGVGVEVQDLLTDEVVFVIDQGLGKSGRAGLCLVTRLLRFPQLGVNMSSGAGMVVNSFLAEALAADIRSEIGNSATRALATMDAKERSRLAARILREALEATSE
jgi:hypothetical protein